MAVPTVTAGALPRRYGPRHRWVVLAVGVGAQGSFSAMFSGIPVTGVSMRAGYHLSTGALGLALACLGLGVAVSDIVWGLLTDRFGDRRVLLTGLTSTGVLLVVMATAVTPADGAGTVLLAVCLTIAGALGGSVNGASGRAVMTWFGEGERGFAMSVRQTAIPAGARSGWRCCPGWRRRTASAPSTPFPPPSACSPPPPPGAGCTNPPRSRPSRPPPSSRRAPSRGHRCGDGTCGGSLW